MRTARTQMQGRRAARGLMDPATAVAYTGPRFAVTGAAYVQAAQPFDPVPTLPEELTERTEAYVAREEILLAYPSDALSDSITL